MDKQEIADKEARDAQDDRIMSMFWQDRYVGWVNEFPPNAVIQFSYTRGQRLIKGSRMWRPPAGGLDKTLRA